MPSTITYCFDVVSPYSYIGFKTLLNYEAMLLQNNVTLELKPIFLGAIMHNAQNQTPAANPLKGKYMLKDIARIGKQLDFTFKMPAAFPISTVTNQRLLVALEENPTELRSLAVQFWESYWIKNEDISQKEIIEKCLKNVGFADKKIEELVAKTQTDEIKNKLKNHTQDVIELGGFGAPISIVEKNGKKEWYFGSDRFELLFDTLGLEYKGYNPNHIAPKL